MTSINHYNNLCLVTLHCPTTSASGSGVSSYCKSQETAIKEAKEELEKCTNDSEQKSKKEKDLKKLQSGLEEHINTDHSLDESTRKTKIKEVKGQQKFVDNFKKNFTGALDGNILVNLCDGLEKFLGFDKDSKGYDGTGIVYSDLDRLCDGVMAFLSGVLKDVSEKQPYSVGKNVLVSNILTLFNNNLCSGREGFKKLFDVLPERIEQYNSDVQQGNERVKKPINDLLNYVDKQSGKLYSGLNNLQVDMISGDSSTEDGQVLAAEKLVKQSLQNAETFNNALDIEYNYRDIKNTINDINDKLRDRVNSARDTIMYERQRLNDVSTKVRNDRLALERSYTNELAELQERLRDMTQGRMERLQTFLIAKVDAVHELLVDVHMQLKQYVKDLDQWINLSLSDADGIIKKVGDMTSDGFVKIEKEDVSNAAGKLRDDAGKLWADMGKAYTYISGRVQAAQSAFDKVQKSVEGDLQSLRDGIRRKVTAYFLQLAGVNWDAVIAKSDNTWTVNDFHDAKNNRKFKKWIEDNVKENKLDFQIEALRVFLKDLIKRYPPPSPSHSEVESTSGFAAMSADAASQMDEEYGEEGAELRNSDGMHLTKYNGAEGIKLVSVPLQEIGQADGLPKLTGIQDKDGKVIEGNTFPNLFSIVGNKLADIVEKFVSHGNGITHELETMKTSSLRCIADAKNRIEGLLIADLRKCISTTKYISQKTIPNATKRVISDLDKYVTAEVIKSKSSLMIIARRNYVSSVKSLLTAFADKVSRELEPLPGEIERDLTIGFKGLMRVMGGMNSETGQPDIASGTVRTDAKSLLEKIRELAQPSKSSEPMKDTFKQLSEAFHTYFTPIHTYVNKQIKSEIQSETEANQKITTENVKHLDAVNTNFNKLLTHLKKDINPPRAYIFDDKFTTLHETLSSSLTALHPSHFANPRHPELLDAVKKGLQGVVEEMGRVYVNGYDGEKESITFDELVINGSNNDKKLTDDGRNLSKVFLTILVTLKAGFDELVENTPKVWKNSQIHLQDASGNENSFGRFFEKCGYKVSKSHDSHEGHLRNKEECTGSHIFKQFSQTKADVQESVTRLFMEILDSMYDCVEKYNDVCHLSTLDAKRHPCSVYEMLVWLSGLTHNPVHKTKIDLTILDTITNINKAGNDEEGEETSDILVTEGEAEADGSPTVSLYKTKETTVDDYPRNVTYAHIRDAITNICSEAYDVLIGIAGHGNAFTMYGSDFSNNSMKFHHPQSGEDCLDMLLDILRRLLPTLQYLKRQCQLSNNQNGWYSCKYGKNIKTSKWPCKEHPTDQPIEEPSDEPNDESNCQPNSPLMSYLNDCLPGHLPHQLTKIGCKYECSTCSITSKKGMPCLTPLGFRGFSGSTQMGKDLCDVLTKFINVKYLPGIFTLAPRPPSTLSEHFGFTLPLIDIVSTSINGRSFILRTLQDAFNASIAEQSINLCTDQSTLATALTNAYGSSSSTHGGCKHAHLKNLITSDSCKGKTNPELECTPYLSTLCRQSYVYLAKQHCNLYLSWAVYLPWNFWVHLKNLYDAFCSITCQDWGCISCLRGDKCKRGDHGSISDASKQPNCQCHSIVDCKGVSPTLYSYGFTFGDPSYLNHKEYPNTCADFRKQLNNVLTSDYFRELFDKCDNFLFKIRAPFIWLNVALWLLSFLYLLHIMVIRLDLLHIKSHLHSPSSHRIAAQSLLAAARVNKLNRVFYLQP